ncbi:PD-(D/E)XK nuclease family protein [Methanocorpusculum sp. MG]|uniref:PD-(D/E)XK nuclease family protein n=1 Tax=Methanocorpusculum petauri TaxID=3002863 RepID=A0ABT4IFP7_9EURY|nr:PD-(D/E)XK nuclease family protein [Methanocorpusculum petauri]MCZ0860552.1 PD-(D/E)XK nuclease family protein [Methanocorpusculum petauri]
MAATIRYGLPGTALDAYTAEYLSESKGRPAGVWMILPVNRLAETLKQDMAAQKIPFIPSRITTVSAFAETVVTAAYPGVRILSPVEQKLIFSRIVENSPELCRLLSPKTDIADSSGRSMGLSSVENLVTLYNTLRFRRAALPKGNDRLAALSSVFTAYENFCEIEQIADSPAVLRLAADAVRCGKFPLQSVYLYGIFSPKELEADLLDAVRIAANRISEFVPHAANDKIFPPREDVLPDGSDTGDFAESVFQQLSISPDLPIKKIGVFSNRIAELSAIAEEICCLIESGVKPGDIAVLTPEVPLYAELAGELFSDFSANGKSLEFTSSIGHPLFRSRSIAAVFSLLKTVLGNYTAPDMTTLFSYPYFFWGERYIPPRDLTCISRSAEITGGRRQWLEYPKALRARFVAGMDDPEIPAPEKSELAAKVQRIDTILKKLEDVFTLLDQLSRKNRSASEFVTVLRHIFAELSYPQGHLGRRLPREDAAAVERFSSVLADIDAAETLMRPERISLGRFYAMLFAFVKSVQSSPPPSGNAENEVKILGFREIVHQKIPYVFLAGLTADVLPRVHPRLPFLTMTETLEAGTQTYEETLREERYAFLSAILAAEDAVYLSAPASDDGSAKIPSAWLKMFDLPNTGWNCRELRHSASWLSEHAGRLISEGRWEEGLDCSRLPDLSDAARRIEIETVERAGPPATIYDAVFSSHPLQEQFKTRYSAGACFTVTDLERYAACPFRWYTELHLRLIPHPDPESDERPELGNVIHKTMYRLITESENFPPSKETRDAAVSDLLKIADEEFSKVGLATPKWQSLRNRYIGTPSYPGRLSEVIDHEIALAETGSVTPKELLEYPFSMAEMPGVLLPDGSELRVEGRVDRIRFLGGTYIVTDYKTGRAKNTAEIESGRSLQLPLYLAAMDHLHPDWTRGGGTYYRIAAGAVEETNPLSRDADCFVPNALLHAVRCRAGMQQGRCQPVYDKTVCEHCREHFICRFDRLRSLAGGDL